MSASDCPAGVTADGVDPDTAAGCVDPGAAAAGRMSPDAPKADAMRTGRAPRGTAQAAMPADAAASDGVSGRRRLGTVLLITGITALAFNLRPAVTSLPPVFPELAANLGLSSGAVTALATLPVVCFGVFSGLAARLGRRFGDEQALFAALIVVAVGLALRGGFPSGGLFPATALAAGAIAIMNVLLSGLIKRRMPERAGLLIGIYLLSLSVGAIIGSLISVPVYQASGGSARLVLGLWAVPAAVAAVMWLPQVSRRLKVAPPKVAPPKVAPPKVAPPKVAADPGAPAQVVPADTRARGLAARRRSSAGHAVHRHLLGWQVAGFMGLQSLTYYATLSWLPILFRDRGASPAHAGVLISVATLGGAFTSLIVPVLAHRAVDQRLLVIPTVLVSGAGIAAALYAPMSSATFWMFVLGLGQGASLGLAIFFTMARAATPAIAASLSSLAQSAGYLLASTGPLLVGFLHTATAGWTVPIFLLLGITGIELVVGYLASRERIIS